MFIVTSFFQTLRHYPEDRHLPDTRLWLLLRQVHLQGHWSGSVTATLLAGVLIGQLGSPSRRHLRHSVS